MNQRAVSDAKAIGNTTVRGAIQLCYQLLDVSGASKPQGGAKLEEDPAGKTGLAGGAHEQSEKKAEGAMDKVLQSHEKVSATKDDEAKPHRVAAIDGATLHVLMLFVPDEYKDSFNVFDSAILDPKAKEPKADVELKELTGKQKSDIEFGVGVSLIFLESVLRA
jgi:hypothetical protein